MTSIRPEIGGNRGTHPVLFRQSGKTSNVDPQLLRVPAQARNCTPPAGMGGRRGHRPSSLPSAECPSPEHQLGGPEVDACADAQPVPDDLAGAVPQGQAEAPN